jgi:hypothetical protein
MAVQADCGEFYARQFQDVANARAAAPAAKNRCEILAPEMD